MKKIRVGLLFGGRSAEHEVSVLSARNIYQALDKNKYEVTLIGIDKAGHWCLQDEAVMFLNSQTRALTDLSKSETAVTLVPHHAGSELVGLKRGGISQQLDVVFPVLHGTYGEDGTMQGLLKLANVPFVGPGVLGSAVSMDKDVMKRLFRDAGLPLGKFLCVYADASDNPSYQEVTKLLGTPLFVKPANAGSSVGISRASNEAEYRAALEEAFQFDRKLVIEEQIIGRELECAVLGNDHPAASGIGEIVPAAKHGFYSYDAKYMDKDGAQIIIPADIPDEVAKEAQDLAIRAFRVLCCAGLSRVDFFLRGKSELLLNEINTLPGFTSISMYPKLWEQSGISYSKLLDRLLELAIERHEQEQKLKTSY